MATSMRIHVKVSSQGNDGLGSKVWEEKKRKIGWKGKVEKDHDMRS